MSDEKQREPSAEDNLHEQEEKAQLALHVDKLRAASLKVISQRERVPQPLFWSLFHSKLNEIKEKRKKIREEKAKLYQCEWL